MNAWMRMLLSLSLSGAVMALIILAAVRLFGKRLGRRWQYYVWLLVVCRLLLPVAAPVNLMGTLFAGYETVYTRMKTVYDRPGRDDTAAALAGLESAALAGMMEKQTAFPVYQESGPEPAAEQMGNLEEGLVSPVNPYVHAGNPLPRLISIAPLLIWLAVALFLLGRKIHGYLGAVRMLGSAHGGPDEWIPSFDRALKDLGLKRRPRLLAGSAVPSPVAAGILHPFVAMPDDFPGDRVYCVFLHELTHIRRRDTLYKWAVELAACIHWFNPAVYLLRRETARACELSCDEAVIRVLDGAGRRLYGSILLETLHRGSAWTGTVMTMPLGDSAKWMKERLGAIMEYKNKGKKCRYAAFLASAVLAGSAVVCGFVPSADVPSAGDRAHGILTADTALSLKNNVFSGFSHKSETSGTQAIPGDEFSWNSEDILRRKEQKGYQSEMTFEEGYILGMAWNVDSSQYKRVTQIDGKTVCYTDKTASFADDPEVTRAIQEAFKHRKDRGGVRQEEVVLLGADGPFEETPDQLLHRFYDEGKMTYFAAAAGKAGAKACGEIADKAYADGRIEYFSMALGEGDTVSQEHMARIAKQAAQDGRAEFFFIAVSVLPDSMKNEFALDAYDRNHVEIFYAVCDSLTSEQAWEIAQRAYEDDRIEYLYAINSKLTDTQCKELKERAKKDGNMEFWYVL